MKKIILFIVLTSTISLFTFGKISYRLSETTGVALDSPEYKVRHDSISISPNEADARIFTVVEQPASFPGGAIEMTKFIQKNFNMPKDVKVKKGMAFVQFVINPDGTIQPDMIQVIKSLHPSFDAEAVRIISIMPRWIPGKQNGNKIRMRYVLPFQL